MLNDLWFGLSVAASVGAENVWKGLLSVGLGLLLATIGTDAAVGLRRFNFGSTHLMAGIHFVPLILGLFAVSEVFVQGHKIARGAYRPPKMGIDFPSLAEFWRLKTAMVRSVVIGFFAGILPGIGATLAAFLSYTQAVSWSKNPERFGTGELEGVVAPETANNAATGAAMIPLLAPAILLIATIGCYALRNLVVDVWVMFIAGIAGYFLRRSGYSMAGIVLGVILAHIGESAFVKSAQLFQYDLTEFFTRPICAVLITLALVSLGVSIRRALRRDLAGPRAG